MNCWYITLLKWRYTIACLVITIGFAVTPCLKWLAYAERGYEAIGGEYAPLVLSFVIAVITIQTFGDLEADYWRKRRRRRRDRYVDKVQEVQENAQRSEFHKNRLRESVCIKAEYEFYTIITHSKEKTEKNRTKHRSYAITVISRR